MSHARLFLLVALSGLLSGCGVFHPGIAGSGISQTEYRQVGNFEEVSLSGFGDVNVFVGDAPSVQITTDDNLTSHVETIVSNGVLRIRPRNRIRPWLLRADR